MKHGCVIGSILLLMVMASGQSMTAAEPQDTIPVPPSWTDPFGSLSDTTTHAIVPSAWEDPYKREPDTVATGDIPTPWVDPFPSDTNHVQPGEPGSWEDPFGIKHYSLVVCDSPYLFMGKEYKAPGTYREKVVTGTGYDWVFYLELTLRDGYLFVEKDTIEEGQSKLWRGREFMQTGVYADSLVTATGCDSVYQLQLEVNINPCKMPVWIAPIKAKSNIKEIHN